MRPQSKKGGIIYLHVITTYQLGARFCYGKNILRSKSGHLKTISSVRHLRKLQSKQLYLFKKAQSRFEVGFSDFAFELTLGEISWKISCLPLFSKYIFKRLRKRLIQAYRKERLSQHFLIILFF